MSIHHTLLDENYTFEQYVSDFGKSQHRSRNLMRRLLFEKELSIVLEHNRRDGSSWKAKTTNSPIPLMPPLWETMRPTLKAHSRRSMGCVSGVYAFP